MIALIRQAGLALISAFTYTLVAAAPLDEFLDFDDNAIPAG